MSSLEPTDVECSAILEMKNQRDKLQQYQKRITVITSREHEVAKECLGRGDKQRALLALRRKKYQESLLAKTDQQLGQLQALTSDVEFALVQKDVVFGLQQGTAVLKEIHKEMGGLEKVEMIMGESEDAQAYQKVSTLPAKFTGVTTKLLSVCRKSTKCSAARCRTKRRTRLKTSWRRWSEKLVWCPVYLTHHLRSKKICLKYHKRGLLSEQRGDRKRRNRLRSRSQHDHSSLNFSCRQFAAFSEGAVRYPMVHMRPMCFYVCKGSKINMVSDKTHAMARALVHSSYLTPHLRPEPDFTNSTM